MALYNWFSWLNGNSVDNALPEIFPLSIAEKDFVISDIKSVYKRILTDAFERTDGLNDDHIHLLFDNCVADKSPEGLITLLAEAMVNKGELFLVYDSPTGVVRKADSQEATQIKADYKAKAESSVGVYVNFQKYDRTDMVKLYSALEYSTVAALYKSMNLSKALQLKMSDLRASVGAPDSTEIVNQAKKIAEGLKCGRDVLIDAKDILETASPDLTATKSAMDFIERKRSLYLNMPSTYITGEAPAGLGDSGQGDTKSTERGLKSYYFSICKPVAEALFNIQTSFKSNDDAQVSVGNETLKTFELTSNEFLSAENKTKVINKLFGLPEDAKGDEVVDEPTPTPTPPNEPPQPEPVDE